MFTVELTFRVLTVQSLLVNYAFYLLILAVAVNNVYVKVLAEYAIWLLPVMYSAEATKRFIKPWNLSRKYTSNSFWIEAN